MTRRTGFTLRETMSQCHDLHPRVARTNGSSLRETSPSRSRACGRIEICRTAHGRCRRSRPMTRARSTPARAAAAMWRHRAHTWSRGGRKPDTVSTSASNHDDTGITDVSRGFAEPERGRDPRAGPFHFCRRASLSAGSGCESHHRLRLVSAGNCANARLSSCRCATRTGCRPGIRTPEHRSRWCPRR